MTHLFRQSLLAASLALALGGCNVMTPYQQPQAALDAPLEQNTGWHLVPGSNPASLTQAARHRDARTRNDRAAGAQAAGDAHSSPDTHPAPGTQAAGDAHAASGTRPASGTHTAPGSQSDAQTATALTTVSLLNGAAFNDPVLNTLLQRQQTGNLSLVQAEARLRQAQAVLMGAGAARLPQVSANLGGNRQGSKGGQSSGGSLSSALGGRGAGTGGAGGTDAAGTDGLSSLLGGSGVSNTVQAGTSITWAPDLWGRVAARADASRASLEAAEADRRAAELQAQVSLIQSYWRMRLAEARLALLERSIATAQRSLDLVRNQHKAGLVARADVVQAETRLQSVLTQRHELTSSRDTERHAMAVLMGLPPSALTPDMLRPAETASKSIASGSTADGAVAAPQTADARQATDASQASPSASVPEGSRSSPRAPQATQGQASPARQATDGLPPGTSGKTTLSQSAPAIQMPSVPGLPETLSIDLLVRRPDVRSAERAVAAANAELGITRSAWLPDLTFSTSGSLGAETVANLLSSPLRTWSVGTQLAATLFDGGTRRSTLKQQEAAYDEKVAAYRQSVLTALQEVEDGLLNYQTLRLQEADQQRLVDLAQESERAVRNRYQSGLVNYLELSTAESTSLSAQDQLLSLQANRLNNYITLLSAVGGSWQVR